MHAACAERRVLGLFPHPDDEAYAAAGLLSRCVAAGARVSLVCATRGERGSDRRGDVAAGAALAQVRSAELAQSCRAMRVAEPEFLDLPDGGIATGDRGAAVARVAAILRRERPQVVVTLGRDGVYGSVDHIAWTEIVDDAVAAWDPGARSRLLHAVFPRRWFASLWRALRRAGDGRLVVALDPETLGVEAERVDLRIELGPLRTRKLDAIRAHASQLAGGDPHTLMRAGLVAPLLDEEWFVVARGRRLPAGAADAFAGLE